MIREAYCVITDAATVWCPTIVTIPGQGTWSEFFVIMVGLYWFTFTILELGDSKVL